MWRVVLDNAALTSALVNPHGPAARLLDYAFDGRLRLFATDRMLTLEGKVLRHPALARRRQRQGQAMKDIAKDLPVLLCMVPGGERPIRQGGIAAELVKCASSSHADFIVTSMSLPVQEVQQGGTQIVEADQLLRLVGHGP